MNKIDWDKPLETTDGRKAELIATRNDLYIEGCTRIVAVASASREGKVHIKIFGENGTSPYTVVRLTNPVVREERFQRIYLAPTFSNNELKVLVSIGNEKTLQECLALAILSSGVTYIGILKTVLKDGEVESVETLPWPSE